MASFQRSQRKLAQGTPDMPIATHEAGTAVISKLMWRLMPFLFLLYIVAYLDRINVGFAALQMQSELGLTDEVYGLGAGIFFAGYFFFQVPSNLALARIGARRWIAGLMIVWGIVSAAMIFATGRNSFYVLRFLLGAAEAGFFPGIILYLKNWFPLTARARAVAWFMTAAPLSGVVGGPISGALLGWHNLGGLAGWQWLFLMEALPAVVLGVLVLFVLSDHPGNARWLSEEQRVWLIATLERENSATLVSSREFWRPFLSPKIWLLAFVYFTLNNCSYGISLWLPKVIRSLSGMSNLELGLLSTVPYISAAITMVLVGLHSDRSGERRWHVAIPAFSAGVALLACSHSKSLGPVVVALSISLMGVFSMCGPFWAIPSGILNGAAAAAGIAFINSLGNLGGFFGSYVMGKVGASSGEFIIGAGLCFSGAVVLLVRGGAPGRGERRL